MRCALVFGLMCGVLCNGEVQNGFQPWVLDNRHSLYPTLPIAAPFSNSEKCRNESQMLIDNLGNHSIWAMQMWDSSAKAPVGVIYGNIFHFGNFDECLDITTPVKTQYCLAEVLVNISTFDSDFEHDSFDVGMTPHSTVWRKLKESQTDPSKVRRDIIKWGLCVPDSCTALDMEEAINLHLDKVNNNSSYSYKAHLSEEFCTKQNVGEEFTLGEISFWAFTGVLIILTVSSTSMDLFPANTKESKCRSLLMLFSAKRNVQKLLSSGDGNKSTLDILHGIKFASIIFVVFGHRVGIFLGLSALNYQEVEKLFQSANNMFFVHSDLVVDTFFFVSGLLLCYMMIEKMRKKDMNPFLAILIRISRLAPGYFFILWFQTSAVLRLGSGPLWNVIAKEENKFCQDNWWTNVLFINNYVNSKTMCMPHSWYIPCDLHFFILATFLVIALVKHKRLGLCILVLLTATSIIIPGVVTYFNRLQPLVIFYQDFLAQPRNDVTFDRLYIKSHNRATAYLIGMCTGYFLHSVRNSKKQISVIKTLCSCLLWLALMFAPMAYGSLYYNVDRPYDVIEASLFASLRRLSWTLGFSVFIIAHRFGEIPFLGSLLSSKAAAILSNLTYGLYLIHFNLIMSHVEKLRSPQPFNSYDAFTQGAGDILISLFYAFLLHLTLEAPLKRFLREHILANSIGKLSLEPTQPRLPPVLSMKL